LTIDNCLLPLGGTSSQNNKPFSPLLTRRVVQKSRPSHDPGLPTRATIVIFEQRIEYFHIFTHFDVRCLGDPTTPDPSIFSCPRDNTPQWQISRLDFALRRDQILKRKFRYRSLLLSAFSGRVSSYLGLFSRHVFPRALGRLAMGMVGSLVS